MTTNGLQVATVRRLLFPDTDLKRIAYNASEAAAALQVPVNRVWNLLHSGHIPARHTGKRYIIPGGTLLDILDGEHPHINDHRDATVFEVDRLYTRSNIRFLLGATTNVVRGLVESGRLEETEAIGSARYVTGHTIMEFLGGADEPMRQQDAG